MASLEMGRRVAERLRRDPSLVPFARGNLARWMAMNADAPRLIRCYRLWDELLDGPIEEAIGVLTGEDERSRWLRLSSSFAGLLPPAEVWEIKRKARHDTSTA